MDQIFLRDLEIETIIGIYDWERENRQKITIDLDIATDVGAAAATDGIENALNYKPVAKRLIQYVGESRFQLIETLAESVAAVVLDEFEARWVRVRINKLGAVRHASNVGVVIERGCLPRDRSSPVEVYVSAGSNIDAPANLNRALLALSRRFGGVARSTVYSNRAVGFDGEDFLNMVLVFTTLSTPQEVIDALAAIEDQCGRDRGGPKFGPRSLDLDLLLYGDQVVRTDTLTLPRPELLTRPFMLRPLAELAGHRRHPHSGRFFADIWREFEGEPHAMVPVDIG